jgi:peptidoglycan/LPS O-acetylase OafA/YrhL
MDQLNLKPPFSESYRPEIDGLRALAVIPVIFFHAGFEAFGGGFVGVDVFFVISGYLITSIILRERDSGSFTLAGFYERRARRLLPALFLVLACCIPFGILILTPPVFEQFALGLVGSATFSSNVLFLVAETTYFSSAHSELNPLLHTWSLAVEEQFYLVYPMLLLLLLKFSRTVLWVALSVLMLSSFVFAVAYSNTVETFFLMQARFWELSIGVFLAIILHERGRPLVPENRFFRLLAPMLGLLMILVPVFLIKSFDARQHIPVSVVALIPVLGTALIILFSDTRTIIGRLLSSKPVVGIGLISYSAYLWHQPLLAFYKNVFIGRTESFVLLLLCFLSLVLAYLSWRWVETPFRRRNRFTRRQIYVFSAIGCVLFSAVGTSFYLLRDEFQVENPNIAPSSFADYRGNIDPGEASAEISYACSNEKVFGNLIYAAFCQSKPDAKVDLALLGDSHALHLFVGLAQGLDLNIINLWKPGWNRGAPFSEENAYIFDYLDEPESPEIVLISMWWNMLFIMLGREEFEEKMTETIRSLSSKNKKVILVADIPALESQPGTCLFLNRIGTKPVCGISTYEFEEQREYLEILKQFESFDNVELIDSITSFCSGTHCSILDGNHLLYWDDDHLNERGSVYFANHIIQKSEFL